MFLAHQAELEGPVLQQHNAMRLSLLFHTSPASLPRLPSWRGYNHSLSVSTQSAPHSALKRVLIRGYLYRGACVSALLLADQRAGALHAA